MAIEIEVHTDPGAVGPYLDALAELRIAVFRDWPYLYDGDRAYEERYLSRFAEAEGAVIVLARDRDGNGTGPPHRIVGAATGVPLSREHDAFHAPLARAGWPVDRLFYNCESVLLREHRGRGIYRRFFEEREAWARRLGRFEHMAFCGVVRPEDDPRRPADAAPLDPVWRHFGYAPLDGVHARFPWTDVGDDHETEKSLQFWIKRL